MLLGIETWVFAHALAAYDIVFDFQLQIASRFLFNMLFFIYPHEYMSRKNHSIDRFANFHEGEKRNSYSSTKCRFTMKIWGKPPDIKSRLSE